MGANVIVTEVDAVKAIEAHMEGFRVMPMNEAAKIGDVFVTATGDLNVITKQHFTLMKDGAILANTGHFDVEINVKELNEIAAGKKVVRPEVEEFALKNGKKIYLLAQGRLVNLACAAGHPSEVMDQSFSDQALCSEYLLHEGKKFGKKVFDVPKEIDDEVAKLALETKELKIDVLTEEQRKYLESWREGT
jgi:adenosylhomocysteinase